MITKPQLQRLIITRLNFMHITEERQLPEFDGVIIRQPNNILEWLLPTERFYFGGNGKTWEQSRLELIEGIWNRLNGKPVINQKLCTCGYCKRKFNSLFRKFTQYCNQDCRNASWHVRFAAKRRTKSKTTDRQQV